MSSATVLGSGQIAEWGRLFDPMRQDMEATFTDQVLSRNPLGRQILPNKVTTLMVLVKKLILLLDYGILTHLGKLMVLSVQLSSTSLTLNMMAEQCLKPLMVLS